MRCSLLCPATLCALLALPAALPAGERQVSFRNEVMAVLARAGCSSGPCHGNLNGKGTCDVTPPVPWMGGVDEGGAAERGRRRSNQAMAPCCWSTLANSRMVSGP